MYVECLTAYNILSSLRACRKSASLCGCVLFSAFVAVRVCVLEIRLFVIYRYICVTRESNHLSEGASLEAKAYLEKGGENSVWELNNGKTVNDILCCERKLMAFVSSAAVRRVSGSTI